jgi:hypothetical protein
MACVCYGLLPCDRAPFYYFSTADELRQAVGVDLQQATLFVQLLSPAIPRRPPGMSTPQMQYAAAQATASLPILQWRDRKINVLYRTLL